eukprot:Skav229488  [mRNA]  locus=scaffold4918:171263:182303:- [translate_table: standard]
MVHDTQIEVQARRTVATWLQQAEWAAPCCDERIASGTGLPLGDTDGVIVVKEDQTVAKLQGLSAVATEVMAYFKAKRPKLSGTPHGYTWGYPWRRHEIPQNWVVSSAPLPDPRLLSVGCSPERLARGKLAITLLRCDAWHGWPVMALSIRCISLAADILEELGNGVEGPGSQYKQRGDKKSADKLMQVIRQYLDREMGYVDPKFSSDMMLLDSDDGESSAPWPQRSGIYPDHILFYYNNIGKPFTAQDIFVKLTEEARRERLRRLDAGCPMEKFGVVTL